MMRTVSRSSLLAPIISILALLTAACGPVASPQATTAPVTPAATLAPTTTPPPPIASTPTATPSPVVAPDQSQTLDQRSATPEPEQVVEGETDNSTTYKNEQEQSGTSDSLINLDKDPEGLKVGYITELKNNKETLLNYVNSGGTLIYQYNTSRGIDWEDFAPYEIGFTGRSSDSRVSVEEAEITILKPNNEVLNSPNKITTKDFEGWVQERGLYFPSTWSGEYEAILSSHDPGEDPKNGGLLVARYGDGYFVYTGYAWFRQLPAGVPGAFRLFANIISQGNKEKPDKTALNSTNK